MQLLIMIDRHASLDSLKPLPWGDKAAHNHILKEYVMPGLRRLSHRSQDGFTTERVGKKPGHALCERSRTMLFSNVSAMMISAFRAQ